MVRFWGNQNGSSIVGQLVATGIALGAFLIIVAIMTQSTKTYQRVELTQRMIEAEIRLLSYYANFENLKALKLENGTPASANLVADQLTVGRIGAPLFVNEEGVECGNETDPVCQIRVETDIACTPKGASGYECKAAYRISSIKKNSVSLGTMHAGPFVPADYKVPLSYELSMRKDDTECKPAVDMFSAGMNKETGEMYCVKKPTTKCGENQIAKGFRYNSGTGAVEPICEETQTITCPPNYAVRGLYPRSLQLGASKADAVCVFVTQSNVPWSVNPPEAQAVSGKFCPPNYRTVDVQCQIVSMSPTPGTCSYQCGSGVCERPAVIVPGSVTIVQGVDQTASCTLNRPAQECGASWDARVRMTGRCQLIPPETVSPL
ncbi:hypothetical protein D3C87_145830 [compost metagenome]